MNSSTARQVAQAADLFRAGRIGQAEQLLLAVVERDASISRAFELLGYIHGNRGDLARCRELLEKAAALPGCPPEALYDLGRVQLQCGRAREAVASFARAMQAAGEFFEGLHEQGVAYGALCEHEHALRCFQRAERLQPRSPELQSNLGDTLAALRRFEPALGHYERALALDPRFVQAWSNRGTVLAELGRGAAALASYERALALAPDDVPTWMNKASTLNLLKREEEALACYDAAQRLAPDLDYLAGNHHHAQMFAARWEGWSARAGELSRRVEAGEKAAPPFTLLSLPVDPGTLLACARTFVLDRHPPRAAAGDGAAPAAPG
ncbi:MAG: tetratricopeptide repeat protein, partial [Xenophilus sp.]